MIFTSRYPPVSIPEASLTAVALRKVQAIPEKPALIDGPTGRTLTYG